MKEFPSIDMAEVVELVDMFHRDLIENKSDEVMVANRYLTAVRNLNNETLIVNKLGYCQVRQELPRCLVERHYGRFIFGRAIVPIFGEFGELISFATRSCIPSLKGWWHLPFTKKNHLFLFDKSRRYIFEQNKVYVMEGFMDTLVAFQESVRNVIAVMGTTLQGRGIGLLKRYCDSICLCFDVDPKDNEAGQRAQIKSIATLSTLGFENISQIILPEGTDPDEYIIRHGVDNFYALERTVTEEERMAAQQAII